MLESYKMHLDMQRASAERMLLKFVSFIYGRIQEVYYEVESYKYILRRSSEDLTSVLEKYDPFRLRVKSEFHSPSSS